MNAPARFVGGDVAADFLGRLYVRTLALLDGRETPVVLNELLEREPHHSADVSRLDGREGLAVLGCQLEREPHHGDDVSRVDGREGLAVLGCQLQRESRHGDAESRLDGREGLAVLGDGLEREPHHGNATSRLDGDPLEQESRPGDGEEVDSPEDDLEDANSSTLTVETIKILVSAMMFFKL